MAIEHQLEKKNMPKSKTKTIGKELNTLKKQINNLSYEECIEELESILLNIQDENISLDKIQTNYIKGHLLLKHCEELLHCFEQEIQQINPESLN